MKRFFCILFGIVCFAISLNFYSGYAMPYYGLNPKEITLRAEFCTNYSSSCAERKNNIFLAVKSINNTFIDVGAEFSFNRVVGERSIKRGYQSAKVIVNGDFTEGVGGGVCQVSTTLYNAVLKSGLKVTEFHPHSLMVNYVEPSFDAMVSFGYADLKFINTTKNPIIIKAFADGSNIKISIFGEQMQEKIYLKSKILEEIIPPKEKTVISNDEFPNPSTWSKKGCKSEGYVIKTVNGKEIERKRIRTDLYKARQGIIVIKE